MWLSVSGVRWCEDGGTADAAHVALSSFVGVMADVVGATQTSCMMYRPRPAPAICDRFIQILFGWQLGVFLRQRAFLGILCLIFSLSGLSVTVYTLDSLYIKSPICVNFMDIATKKGEFV